MNTEGTWYLKLLGSLCGALQCALKSMDKRAMKSDVCFLLCLFIMFLATGYLSKPVTEAKQLISKLKTKLVGEHVAALLQNTALKSSRASNIRSYRTPESKMIKYTNYINQSLLMFVIKRPKLLTELERKDFKTVAFF